MLQVNLTIGFLLQDDEHLKGYEKTLHLLFIDRIGH